MRCQRRLVLVAAVCLLVAAGCAHRYYAGDLKPLDEAVQGPGRTVADDGTVTFTQGRLVISLRPMTDDELNRQFPVASSAGSHSTNPYTFGDGQVFRTGDTPARFTVFRVKVENYEYPKVYLDPGKIHITAQNGRKYRALSLDQLIVYYRRYEGGGFGGDSPGIPGNPRFEFNERRSTLLRTLYPDEVIFSAQEKEGYVVFEPLAPDVSAVTVRVSDVVVRFDYTNDPVETIDVSARFKREIGRIYPDGRMVASQR